MLKVRDVIVCGHYGCGGARAALDSARLGLIDNWLRAVRDIADKHCGLLDAAPNREDCLCELNVIEQVRNVGNTTVVRDAWARGQPITIHGWIYALHDGLLHDLRFVADSPAALACGYRDAVNAVAERSTGNGSLARP